MKLLISAIAASLALAACQQSEQAGKAPAPKAASAADVNAGKALSEAECKGCHGLDGKGTAPAIPHLAAQSERYLLAALAEYKSGKRTHAALREIASHLSEAQARNVAGYYASLPAVAAAPAKDVRPSTPYEQGKALAAACSKCHGDDGNSSSPGIPSLAAQQPRYLVVAIQEYLNRERKASPMHTMVQKMSRTEMESIALYFASQTPAPRAAPAKGDATAGEPLSAVCGGCHGPQGVSTDTATPGLAGQDPRYLVEAIKAYRTSRKRESMRLYVSGLSEKDVENIAAFYSSQKSRPAEKGQTIVQDLTDKCNRCHAPGVENPAMVIPKIAGQDRDYLVMALRAYRDDRRESTTMHKMSLPYGDSIIESIAFYYAGQPAK
jgi:cytochrome c553